MHLNGGAVMRRTGDGDLELARQVGKFRMDRGPLTQDFRGRARIGNFIGGNTGKMISGDIADAVAGGLQRVHLDFRQFGQNSRHVFERRPIVLDVLAGGEMAIAAVIGARDMGKFAHLF